MTLVHILFLIGISAEAMSAAVLGMRHRMDLFGILLLSAITALGGGMVRDVLLDHYPVSWVAHPEYLAFTSVAALVTLYIARYVHRLRLLFLTADALGLVVFVIVGCNVGREQSDHWMVALLAGVITGIFGGLLRDIITNEVPLVLRRDLYATVAFLTGGLYLGLLALNLRADIVTVCTLVFGFSFRMLALRFGWGLPAFSDEGVRGFD